MKKILFLILSVISICIGFNSCLEEERNQNNYENYELYTRIQGKRVTDMKVEYQDLNVEIRTYKLDGHDRIMVRTAKGTVSDNHLESCKKCYEDPCN